MAIGRRGGPGAASRRGHVWLVGAGPGDPGLITVRGAELVASADVIVSDLAPDAALHGHARAGAEIVRVGPDGEIRGQDETNALLVDRALSGARVVRLKVGDPYLLGRGGEEAEACAAAGVAVTVVPGVSAALAGPAYAGIPVTHRGLAQDVVIVAGHLPPDHPDSTVDWAALASPTLTVVIMMGVAHLVAIADALLAAGREPGTPVAVVERATTPAQRVLRTTLESLGADAVETGVRSPAVIVVGDVAARIDARGAASPSRGAAARPRLSPPGPAPAGPPGQIRPPAADRGARWVAGQAPGQDGERGNDGRRDDGVREGAPPAPGPPTPRQPDQEDARMDRMALPPRPAVAGGPLAGVRVLVPRTRARPSLLARDLRRQGAEVVETIVSTLAPVPDAGQLLEALPGADALVLADADEVAAVVTLLRGSGRDVRALAGLTLVSASESAAAALDALGLATVRSSAEVRVAHVVVTEIPVTGLRVAVCAAAAPPMGVRTVRRITLQTDIPADPDAAVADDLRRGALHAAAFASSTAARMTAHVYSPLPAGLLVAAIGRRTVAACREAGIRVDAVAAEPGIAGLVAALCQLVAPGRLVDPSG
ncbi:uroporphyrinogen-III C-methyltransferase [Frankia sp. CNm7]|uniref:uroporphyrinogen-III C-methyltransferase n=1 Tax=Frankia nepalensis TaxID=1836974 RepID=A0A937UR08_9ACTN|nr:uroporphyrinogen-III C-methyltransferase [Frankia nepalensis]MBL7496054.1 uroporphyrinogen-III C-methyltransferase [Frankia nepalensis]MBL7511825.1 uroporphyrinogen-III C-methyltransferase [Frankia nepalensis]MBL7517230.1 uroporphyrinogen-III C-methyltransferase [Frankia nepalensis]MBL7630658.1 uroporphyrinogen-III C-methyltransferase [Frankia nepalensis]